MPDLLVACLRDLAACAYHLKVLHRSADSMVNIYVYIYMYIGIGMIIVITIRSNMLQFEIIIVLLRIV